MVASTRDSRRQMRRLPSLPAVQAASGVTLQAAETAPRWAPSSKQDLGPQKAFPSGP